MSGYYICGSSVFACCHDLQQKNITIVVHTHADLQSNSTYLKVTKTICVCVFSKLENVCRLCASSTKHMEFPVCFYRVWAASHDHSVPQDLFALPLPACQHTETRKVRRVWTQTHKHTWGAFREADVTWCLFSSWAKHIRERWFRTKKRLAIHLNH